MINRAALNLCLLCFLSFIHPAVSESVDLRYLHTMLGVLDAEESWQIEDGAQGEAADIDDMIYGGGAAQFSHLSGSFQYGFESGGLISYHNDTSSFVRVNENGATVKLDVDNAMWLVDFSLGAYVSYQPWEFLRVFVSAGPAFLIGSILVEEEDITISGEGGETVQYTPSEREYDADLGVYGRIGLDIILEDQFIVGVSARRLSAELDFGDIGVIELDDTQFFINLGKRY
jgi:hypothetical protein